MPERRGRNPNQKWVFLTDESLKNIFYSNPSLQIQDFNGLFNWSMSYHHFNDVPVPYGRVVPKGLASKNDQIQNDFDPTINKTKLAAVMTSNCMKGSKRWAYIGRNLLWPRNFTEKRLTFRGNKQDANG